MTLDKKQLPQLAILGVLVVVGVGALAFQFSGSKRATLPTPAAKASSKPAGDARTADMDGEKVAAADLEFMPASVFPGLVTPAPRRDPFRPSTIPGAVDTPGKTSASAGQNSRTQAGMAMPQNTLPYNPFKDFSQGSGPGAIPQGRVAQVQPEPDPEFTLTGVIRGSSNVAIIRSGDSGRHIVRQGQFIDGRYKVVSVSENGAVLAHNNRRIYVKLGGVKNER